MCTFFDALDIEGERKRNDMEVGESKARWDCRMVSKSCALLRVLTVYFKGVLT